MTKHHAHTHDGTEIVHEWSVMQFLFSFNIFVGFSEISGVFHFPRLFVDAFKSIARLKCVSVMAIIQHDFGEV